MMSHEFPVQIGSLDADESDYGNSAEDTTSKKSNKKLSNKGKDKKSPGGASKNKKSSKTGSASASLSQVRLPDAMLPDGSKPNFGTSNLSTSLSNLKKKPKSHSLPNGDKPVFSKNDKQSTKKKVLEFNAEKNNKKQNKCKEKKTETEETYAGSSFHSSPAALNLPKPSFKASPKTAQLTTDIYHPPPPQYPVTLYGSQNSLAMQSRPFFPGYTNMGAPPPSNGFGSVQQMHPPYNYHHNGYHPNATPAPSYFPHQAMGRAPQHANYVPNARNDLHQGHKISFNELIGSSKN